LHVFQRLISPSLISPFTTAFANGARRPRGSRPSSIFRGSIDASRADDLRIQLMTYLRFKLPLLFQGADGVWFGRSLIVHVAMPFILHLILMPLLSARTCRCHPLYHRFVKFRQHARGRPLRGPRHLLTWPAVAEPQSRCRPIPCDPYINHVGSRFGITRHVSSPGRSFGEHLLIPSNTRWHSSQTFWASAVVSFFSARPSVCPADRYTWPCCWGLRCAILSLTCCERFAGVTAGRNCGGLF